MERAPVWRSLLPLLLIVNNTHSYDYYGSVYFTETEEEISHQIIPSIELSTPEEPKTEIVWPRGNKHTGTVIFLHGVDGTGLTMKSCVEALYKNSSFPHLKIVYPSSPQEMNHNIWYNKQEITVNFSEPLESIDSTADELVKLIEEEVRRGIPQSRIVIGGYSMGGSMAMHLGYRYVPELGGVFVLGSYLNNDSITYEELKKEKPNKLPALFYAHGDIDDTVDLEWGRATFEKLQSFGVKGVFHTIPNTLHKLRKQTIDLLFHWINDLIPNS